jgi:hypothetical protein
MFMLRKDLIEKESEEFKILEILCLQCYENLTNPETILYPYNAVKSSHALELLMKKHVEKLAPEKHSPEMKIEGPDEVEVRCGPGDLVQGWSFTLKNVGKAAWSENTCLYLEDSKEGQ